MKKALVSLSLVAALSVALSAEAQNPPFCTYTSATGGTCFGTQAAVIVGATGEYKVTNSNPIYAITLEGWELDAATQTKTLFTDHIFLGQKGAAATITMPGPDDGNHQGLLIWCPYGHLPLVEGYGPFSFSCT